MSSNSNSSRHCTGIVRHREGDVFRWQRLIDRPNCRRCGGFPELRRRGRSASAPRREACGPTRRRPGPRGAARRHTAGARYPACRVGRSGRGLLTGGCGKPVDACAVAQGRRRAPRDPGRRRANPQAWPPGDAEGHRVRVRGETGRRGSWARKPGVGKRLRECRPHRVGTLGAARTVRRGRSRRRTGSGPGTGGQAAKPAG